MTIVERIDSDIIEAMKSKQAERLSALRMAKTALKKRETELPGGVDDAEAARVLNTLIKQWADAAEQYAKAGRADLSQKEENDARTIQSYLPAAATEAEMNAAIEEAIGETAATSMKEMGAVMKAARARLGGKTIDGKTLSDMVKARLSG
ncbi:MAG: GatB/YqeY domain-containing protein [Acidobacteriota bacterium]